MVALLALLPLCVSGMEVTTRVGAPPWSPTACLGVFFTLATGLICSTTTEAVMRIITMLPHLAESLLVGVEGVAEEFFGDTRWLVRLGALMLAVASMVCVALIMFGFISRLREEYALRVAPEIVVPAVETSAAKPVPIPVVEAPAAKPAPKVYSGKVKPTPRVYRIGDPLPLGCLLYTSPSPRDRG